jgi:thiol-disulfide isomerase/thioredoxin
MKTPLLAFIFCFTTLASFADAPTADQVMGDAKTKASAENKTIFLHFGASWCHWCHKLDGFLDQPEIKPVFDKYFVQVKLVVQEDKEHKDLENLGADKLLEKLGGPEGIPYYAFLAADGSLIVNSKRPTAAKPAGENIGYPGTPEEIDWFVQMLKKAAPGMDSADLKTIETSLRTPAKPLKS